MTGSKPFNHIVHGKYTDNTRKHTRRLCNLGHKSCLCSHVNSDYITYCSYRYVRGHELLLIISHQKMHDFSVPATGLRVQRSQNAVRRKKSRHRNHKSLRCQPFAEFTRVIESKQQHNYSSCSTCRHCLSGLLFE